MSTLLESLALVLMPSSLIPPSANLPLQSGMAILFGCMLSTTFDHPSLPLLRAGAAIPAIYCFLDVGWSPIHRKSTTGVVLAMGSMAMLGIMRVVDVCFVRLWDEERPRWILKRSWKEWKEASRAARDLPDGHKGKDLPGALPLPSNLKERLLYTVDLFTSVQGGSWYGDRVWDFAPPSVANYYGPSRWRFVGRNIATIVTLYFVLDFVDICVKSRTYDPSIPNPVTSLPFHLQILASIYTGVHSTVPMNMQTRLSAALAVMLLNTSTNSWPPITGDSWNATSLAEFWIKLHHLFTRSFHRLHLGFHYLIPAAYRKKHPRAMRLLRRGTFFTLSGILHMAFLTMLPVEHHARQWMKPLAISTLKFYCSQPLGLGIEKVLVFPITKNLPLSARMFVQRSFVVGWLLWTSRWWADVWVALGMFVEKPVLFSPLRGLLYGQWILEQRKA